MHLAAAVVALVLGARLLSQPKGTQPHRMLGRLWLAATAVTAVSSFWILEIRNGAGFSLVHLLSVWTPISGAVAFIAIRSGNRRRHRAFMIGTYVGLCVAGLLALAPNRMLGETMFGG